MAKLLTLDEQTPADKMQLLKLEAQIKLGSRWSFFKKIKTGKEGFSLFKEANLVEKMKATRAALIFSSRNTRNSYRLVYRTVTSEIKRQTGITDLPPLPEAEGGGENAPSITPDMDALIISWTPIKFLLPAKLIREKGRATQRHTEGLVAKLYFKVAGYYAIPQNWDKDKLTLYMRKLTPESDFTKIASALKPLKDDLEKFADCYIPFRFGSPSRSKDIPSDLDAYEDVAKESTEQKISDLYWYYFIYFGIEQFLFRYYLIMVEKAPSVQAIRYLTQIFSPAIAKAIELRHIFLGSMDTDRAKRPLREAFEKYKKAREQDALVHQIQTKKGSYESHTYTIPLLEKNKLSYELPEELEEGSEWHIYFDHLFQTFVEREQQAAENVEDQSVEKDELPLREYAILQIMALVLKCGEFRVLAKEKVLERFKNIVKVDREIAAKRIKELQIKAEKELRLKKRKLMKMKAAKQTDMLELIEKDIADLNQETKQHCKQIEMDAQIHLMNQKKRAQALVMAIEKERHHHAWKSARTIFNIAQSVIPEPDYKNQFINFLVTSISQKYEMELELFYKNMFKILEPASREKITLAQAIEKSGGEDSIQLTLDQKDIDEHNAYLQSIRGKIAQMLPGIFKMNVMFGSLKIPIENLISFSLDNKSLHILASLKVTAPNKPFFKLPGEVVRALLVLNSVSNPIPKHNLIMADRVNEKNPEKMINTTLLNKVIDNQAHEQKNMLGTS